MAWHLMCGRCGQADGFGVAVSPDRTRIYVTHGGSGTASVPEAGSNAVASVAVGQGPHGVAQKP